MTATEIIKTLTSRSFLCGAFAGWATAFFFVREWITDSYRYDIFGMFLLSFALYILLMWGFPIVYPKEFGDKVCPK